MRRPLAWLLAGLLAALPARAERLAIGLAAAPAGLDPHFYAASSDTTVTGHIFEGLVQVAADGRLEPGLATDWTVVDEHIWDFALRQGVRFHDGSPFGAEDVVASFARIPTLKTAMQGLASKLQAIASLEPRAGGVLRIRTHVPTPSLAFELHKVAILRRAGLDGAETEDFNSGRLAVGTGPFRFAGFQPDSRLDLTASPDWWGGPVAWSRVALRFIPRDAVRTAALLAGDIDVIERVAPADLPLLAARPGIALAQAPGQNTVYVILNIAAEPGPHLTGPGGELLAANPLRDRRVRQALSLAVPRPALAERLLAGAALPAWQFAPIGTPDHLAEMPLPAQNLPRSRALLAEAGYAAGLRLELHGPADRFPNIAQVAEALAQAWARVGIATTVETMPWTALARRTGRGNFAALLFGCCSSIADPVMTTRDLLATHDPVRGIGGSNYGRYANPLLDRLVEGGLTSFDPAARRAALIQAAAIVAEDVPIVPLYHPLNSWAARVPLAYTPRLDSRTPATGARRVR